MPVEDRRLCSSSANGLLWEAGRNQLTPTCLCLRVLTYSFRSWMMASIRSPSFSHSLPNRAASASGLFAVK